MYQILRNDTVAKTYRVMKKIISNVANPIKIYHKNSRFSLDPKIHQGITQNNNSSHLKNYTQNLNTNFPSANHDQKFHEQHPSMPTASSTRVC